MLKTVTSKNQGFTILEALIAMVVTSILLAAIAPILVMSTAIRVQSKRIEMASQTARTFIEGVRIGSIETPIIVSQLDPTQDSPRNITNSPNDYLISTSEMPAPSSKNELYCVHKNGIIYKTNCQDNLFYVQAGRIVQTQEKNDGYRLAIRVYRGDIDFNKTIKINTGSTTKQTSSTLTAGIGDTQAPLVEMTTDIGNTSTNFHDLCQRLGTPSTNTSNTDAVVCK